MADNLFDTQYDVTKKSKILRFYESNKILIFSTVFIIIIMFVSFSFYVESKEKKRILISDNYPVANLEWRISSPIQAFSSLKIK